MKIIKVDDTFDLEQIAESGQCFRWKKLDHGISNKAYNIKSGNREVKINQYDDGTISIHCGDEDVRYWMDYLDLDTNYHFILDLIPPKDEYLKKAAEFGKGIHILRQSIWETMVSFIISQNNNIPKIKKSIEEMCSYCAKGVFPNVGGLFEVLSDEVTFGTGYRADYLLELCENWIDNPIQFLPKGSYEKDYEFLITQDGIGPKVANCICLFAFHELNACPIDTWMQKIIDNHYDGVQPEWMSGPYAGVYQQYVFYYERNKMKPLTK